MNYDMFLMRAQNIRGEFLEVHSFEISQDGQYLFIKTNTTKVCFFTWLRTKGELISVQQWRYSTFSNVYIFKLQDKTMWPLDLETTIDDVPAVQYITWSPTGHKLVN